MMTQPKRFLWLVLLIVAGALMLTLMNQSAMQVFLRSCIHLDREKMRAFRKKLFENACELAYAIPTFKLRVGLDGRFWEKIEAVLF